MRIFLPSPMFRRNVLILNDKHRTETIEGCRQSESPWIKIYLSVLDPTYQASEPFEPMPSAIMNEQMHSNHRAILLNEDFDYYKHYFPEDLKLTRIIKDFWWPFKENPFA